MERLIVIAGPTASGKTNAALSFCREHNGAVVSADSRQIYAGMNIGTAKPAEAHAETAHEVDVPDMVMNVPHFLLNIRLPTQPLSLATWQSAALAACDTILAAHQQPVLTGGTMLYIDSIVDNYLLPDVAPNSTLREELELESTAALYQRLLTQDPAASSFIEPKNKRRIIRALEVIEATGEPFSTLRRTRPAPYEVIFIGLFPGWDTLKISIEKRAAAMIADGLLDEVTALREKYGKDLPLLQTLNYVEACRVLEGDLAEAELLAAMTRSNLLYARKQMSWWKRRADIQWFTTPDEEFKKALTR